MPRFDVVVAVQWKAPVGPATQSGTGWCAQGFRPSVTVNAVVTAVPYRSAQGRR
ncbi:hypothetical protein AB0J80_37935 [Actinoplanes sp. NPDC049548]|uniref:hypothetical protein n=1 Tax=Actinoplanes sp. NPDC049548 TaxID=3155152 RepID=UPI00343A7C19